jgi:hypothetical protein
LRALTGQAVETLIFLNDDERKRLRAAANLGDEDAIYVLSRLSPQDALDVIAPKFKREKNAHERFYLALMLMHVLPADASSTKVLGPPTRKTSDLIAWRVINVYDEPEELVVDLKKRTVDVVALE